MQIRRATSVHNQLVQATTSAEGQGGTGTIEYSAEDDQ
jgi:hypothetical protein